jgi:hypothetical protein
MVPALGGPRRRVGDDGRGSGIIPISIEATRIERRHPDQEAADRRPVTRVPEKPGWRDESDRLDVSEPTVD